MAAAKAKNFLKILTSKDGVYFLHFLWDLTTCLAKVSKVFQDRMTTVGQIHTELTAAKAVLESFKTRCIFIRTFIKNTRFYSACNHLQLSDTKFVNYILFLSIVKDLRLLHWQMQMHFRAMTYLVTANSITLLRRIS